MIFLPALKILLREIEKSNYILYMISPWKIWKGLVSVSDEDLPDFLSMNRHGRQVILLIWYRVFFSCIYDCGFIKPWAPTHYEARVTPAQGNKSITPWKAKCLSDLSALLLVLLLWSSSSEETGSTWKLNTAQLSLFRKWRPYVKSFLLLWVISRNIIKRGT